MTLEATQYSVLTIAGSDPSGGAGIQADLKTFTAHGCYGTSVITSLTAQNTTGVQGVYPISPYFVAQQIRSVLDDIDINALKTGMLCDKATACEVAAVLKEYKKAGKLPPIVCDPVCVSTSGHTLLQPDAVDALLTNVFPLTTLITPNKAEAETLLQNSSDGAKLIETLEDMLGAAEKLAAYSSAAVLIKGGHLLSSLQHLEDISKKYPNVGIIKQNLYAENMEILQVGADRRTLNPDLVVDLLYQPGAQSVFFARPRLDSTSTHGTGCTLSASIACGLAQGLTLKDAVADGVMYTYLGIATALPIGRGFGPLNHLHSIAQTIIPKPTPSNPYPFAHYLIVNTGKEWKEYVEHNFVRQLGMGTLPREKFVHFIKQDYHYLKYYARAYGLLAAKSSTFSAIHSAAAIIMSVIHEIGTHKAFCQSFGVTPEDLENTPESVATTAYGAYIINVGLQGDSAKLIMALLACLLGYGEVGLWLKKEASLRDTWVVMEGNPYKKWIEDYSGQNYQSAVRVGLVTIEQLVVDDHPSPSRLKQWLQIWARCTTLERGFWDMAMELQK